MSPLQLLQEQHSSTKLRMLLRAAGHAQPAAPWEAHHIVSGGHPEAMQSRTILADDEIKIRIDDPDNGCWMPKTKANARPSMYPNAIGHNRIHREFSLIELQSTVRITPIVELSSPFKIKTSSSRSCSFDIQSNLIAAPLGISVQLSKTKPDTVKLGKSEQCS